MVSNKFFFLNVILGKMALIIYALSFYEIVLNCAMAAPCIYPLLFKQFWTPTCMLQYPWESFNYQKDLWSLPKVFTLPMWFPYILLKWNTGGTLCHVFILQINFGVSKIILRKQRIGSCLTAILYVVLPSIPCFHSLTSV